MEIKRGEIYFADITKYDSKGSEQSGRRPVVILQNNIGNKFSPTTIIACTSQQKVDITLYFYTSFNEHNTPYTVLESDNSESMPDVLH